MRPPLSSAPPVSSGFDLKRKHPIHGYVIPHTGVDYPVPVGTPVLASASGVVVRSAYDPPRSKGGTGAGNLVGINHDNGLGTRYYHLSRRDVTQGQRVKAGQRIGLVGSTGDSTGPHLHFEIRKGGYWGTPINPAPLLREADDMAGYDEDRLVERIKRSLELYPKVEDEGREWAPTTIGRRQMILLREDRAWRAETDAVLRGLVGAVAAGAGLDPDDLEATVRTAARTGARAGALELLDTAVAEVRQAVAAEVVAGVSGGAGVTAEQVEAATERAMRSVLGSLASED